MTPFLPGDSLLFVAGALAAFGGMDLATLLATLATAAVLWQPGQLPHRAASIGPRVFHWENSRFLQPRRAGKDVCLLRKHGGRRSSSRFLPVLSIAPFVAGVGANIPLRFTGFNLTGALLWVGSLTLAGFWFGNACLDPRQP